MKQYDESDHRALAAWALECAARVLPLFEQDRPEDARPRRALDAGWEWVRSGQFSMATIRRTSLNAHAAARAAADQPAACAAARAAGQAVASAHVPQHAYGGAYYALKAVAARNASDTLDAVLSEREWQTRRLPEHLRDDVMNRIMVTERAHRVHVSVNKDGDF